MEGLDAKVEYMHRFTAFEYLNPKQQAIVAGQAKIVKAKPESELFKLNQIDSHDYYLIAGSVLLVAADGKSVTVTADSPTAKRPLANLRPRKYAAICQSNCVFLSLPHDLLSHILESHNEEETREHLLEFSHADLTPNQMKLEIQQAIRQGELSLPSIPEVALRIQRYAEDEQHSIEQLASAIMLDPAITVKLIQYANGPLVRGVSPITTCLDAVVRLGRDTTIHLVRIFALREVFQSSDKALNDCYKQLWLESVDVAVIAAVLARASQLEFEPEVAMMTGLLHKIGALSIYAFANEYAGFLSLKEPVDNLIRDFEVTVACDIVQRWQLGDVYFQCLKYLRHWDKPEIMTPDYSDLLNVAILHECIHQHTYHDLPKFHQLAAFKRIKVGPSTPELSIQVLDNSRQEITALKKILTY